MNKLLISAIALICVFSFSVAQAVILEDQAGDWTVKLSLQGDPVVAGKNQASVSVLDVSGKPVTDAKVKVYYNMKAMAGMSPMNFKTNAKADGDHYIAKVNFHMAGHWEFKIKVKKDGKSEKAKMSLKVVDGG